MFYQVALLDKKIAKHFALWAHSPSLPLNIGHSRSFPAIQDHPRPGP